MAAFLLNLIHTRFRRCFEPLQFRADQGLYFLTVMAGLLLSPVSLHPR